MLPARHGSSLGAPSILQANPAASPAAIRKGLFLRFYGQEFDAATRKRILRALETV